jgi:hypothetical protein
MNTGKHTTESEGSKPRDHTRLRHHIWHHAHRNWKLWIAVALTLAMILTYIFSDNLSLRPGHRAVQSTPALDAP